MVRGQAAAVVIVASGKKGIFPLECERGARFLRLGASFWSAARTSLSRRCLGDWERAGLVASAAGGAAPPAPQTSSSRLPQNGGGGGSLAARGSFLCRKGTSTSRTGTRFIRLSRRRCLAVEERGININASPSHFEKGKSISSLSGNRKLYFDTHAFVCLLERSGFSTQQSEIIVSALINILNSNMNVIYKDMVTKVQQEIALQQIMSHIGGVKKDMIILEKSEFSALRAENEKIKLELQQLKKQASDEISKVRTVSMLDFNIEKSRVKELYSLNERKLLKMRTEIVELHAQQDRALTQTDRKIDTEVAGLKTMLESHKLDNIKYLAGSVFTCLTVALGFYRLWM